MVGTRTGCSLKRAHAHDGRELSCAKDDGRDWFTARPGCRAAVASAQARPSPRHLPRPLLLPFAVAPTPQPPILREDNIVSESMLEVTAENRWRGRRTSFP